MKIYTTILASACVAIFSGFNSYSQNAIDFDGTNDFVQTTYPGVLASANRTFEAWVYVSSSAPASNLAILDYGSNSSGGRNTFNVTGVRALSFISGGTNANISSSPGDVPVDQWTHVAFVLNSGTGYLYVNGVQSGTGSLSSVNTPSGNENLKIGQRISGGSIPFYGAIDEVRIWSVARTPAEILANMNNEMCSLPIDLEAYYRFNQGIAGGANALETIALDDSGNGNNGTLTNIALTGATSNWVTGATLTGGFSASSATVSDCNTYTWAANSTTYTTSGIYTETLSGANAAGCDSILVLDLTINTSNDLTTNVQACDSFTWSVNGTTYNSSTTVSETLQTGAGCDYLHTLNLTLGTSYDTTYQVSSCGDYSWSLSGLTYATAGIYPYTMTLPGGCDSIAYLDLSITPFASIGIQDNGDGSLTATGPGSNFQWIDCGTGSAISGETQDTYTPTVNGSYAVYVSGDPSFCGDTSECFVVDNVGIEESTFANLSMHPNPTKGEVTVDLGSLQGMVSIAIYSVDGQLVQSRTEVNVEEFTLNLEGATGMYLMKIEAESGEAATLRIVKN